MTNIRERRLALVTTSFPIVADGSEAAGAFVSDFARAISEWVHVSVVTPGLAEGRQNLPGVDVTYFRAPRVPLSLLEPWSPADWLAIVQTLRAGARAVDALVAERRIDHILALWALPSGYWARRAASRAGIRYSVWGLGSDIWTLGRIPLVRGVLRRVLRRAEHRFADGIGLAHDMQAIGGGACGFLPSSRHLPRPRSRPVKEHPPFRLAFLGRWHPNKGIDLLLDALGRLDDGDWARIEAVRIAGGGPLEETVANGVSDLQAAGRPVGQQGFLDVRAASALFDWSDFVLLPSRIESIPVVFSDAMQAGRPIICTPVGDLPRLLTRYGCGVLAAGATPGDFAAALKRALDSCPTDLIAGTVEAAHDFDVRTTSRRVVGTLFGATVSADRG